MRLAKLKANRVFTAPCDTSVLYPTSGGNIHEFTAITPCAFLDVIGPPYSKDDGRDCSYYRETPCNDLVGKILFFHIWLVNYLNCLPVSIKDHVWSSHKVLLD